MELQLIRDVPARILLHFAVALNPGASKDQRACLQIWLCVMRENTHTQRKGLEPHNMRHIPALDGLRGLACLAVVGFHAFGTIFRGGQLGVDVFFVLSGFLITNILLQDLDTCGAIRFKHFYIRRARRLLPAWLELSRWQASFGRSLAEGVFSRIARRQRWVTTPIG
jgi:hypothetical protein